jgi:acetyltransferase
MVRLLEENELKVLLPQLADLLWDAVDHGASVGFLPPLDPEQATAFWQRCLHDCQQGRRRVWVAVDANSRLVGSVQLELVQTPNGLHRAEVQKLLVHSQARRQGWATRLMAALEEEATRLGRTLLVLDTCQGSGAQQLYHHLGWREAGVIPQFARVPEGYCHTVVFYKQLGSQAAGLSGK